MYCHVCYDVKCHFLALNNNLDGHVGHNWLLKYAYKNAVSPTSKCTCMINRYTKILNMSVNLSIL